MKLIQDLGMLYPNSKSKTKVRYGLYECSECKNSFRARVDYASKRKTSMCKDCVNKFNAQSNKKHGERGTRLYSIWASMKTRCNNKNCKAYKDYGARGISICKEWNDNFSIFRDWALDNGYDDNLSIDRINNNGNYEPSNCRWTTNNIQSRNTRLLSSSNSTGYRGVSWHKRENKYNARITIDGNTIALGSYIDAIDAAIAFDEYVVNNNLEHTTNFSCGVRVMKEHIKER